MYNGKNSDAVRALAKEIVKLTLDDPALTDGELLYLVEAAYTIQLQRGLPPATAGDSVDRHGFVAYGGEEARVTIASLESIAK